MIYDEKKITKLTLEIGDATCSWEVPYSDSNLEQLLDAFYGLCISQTYSPSTVLNGMKEFATSHLPEESNEEED